MTNLRKFRYLKNLASIARIEAEIKEKKASIAFLKQLNKEYKAKGLK